MSHLILLFHRIAKQITVISAPTPPPVDTQFLITDLGDFLITDGGDSLIWA